MPGAPRIGVLEADAEQGAEVGLDILLGQLAHLLDERRAPARRQGKPDLPPARELFA
jgi:hypothetical protein